MTRLGAALFSLLALAALAAAGEPRLTVLATDPEPGATLHFGESLFVRYRVDDSSPVFVRAEGWSAGKQLPLANSGSADLPAGGGEDGAFLFSNAHKAPAGMDELRLVATDADGRPAALLSIPMRLTWDMDRPAVERPRPDWVRAWSDARTRKMDDRTRAYQARTSTPGNVALSMLLMPAFGLGVLAVALGCLVLPFAAVYYWRGGWRAAALPPLLAMGFVVARVVRDTSVDPASHNLWPFEILMAGVPGLAFLGAVALARRFSRESARID